MESSTLSRKMSITDAGTRYFPARPYGDSSTPTRHLLSLLVAAFFVLSGCVDLTPVKDYAALSKQASEGYSGIVEDMYQSCLRSAQFDPPTNGDTPEKHCVEWKEVQPGLLHAESTLQDYLVALGKLAGDDTISYDKNLDSVKKEVDGIKLSSEPVFDSKKVDAITGVGSQN